MSRYTPGPWEVSNLSAVCSAIGADSGDGCKADQYDCWQVAECGGGMTLVDGAMTTLGFDVVKANARLIAAAPDLLEALVALTGDAFPRFTGGCVGTFDIQAGDYEKALSAISRAKGEK